MLKKLLLIILVAVLPAVADQTLNLNGYTYCHDNPKLLHCQWGNAQCNYYFEDAYPTNAYCDNAECWAHQVSPNCNGGYCCSATLTMSNDCNNVYSAREYSWRCCIY